MEQNIPEIKQELANWIRHILERKQWSPTQLARESKLAPSTVIRLLGDENYEFAPTLRTLRKISDGSSYPIPGALLDWVVDPRMRERNPQIREQMAQTPERQPLDIFQPNSVKQSSTRQNTLPVRSMLRYGPVADSNGYGSIDIPRPDYLVGDGTAFAFYMPDSDLEPWYPEGAEMYATRRRQPRAGRDLVVITLKDKTTKVRLLRGTEGQTLRIENAHHETDAVTMDSIDEIAIVVGAKFI